MTETLPAASARALPDGYHLIDGIGFNAYLGPIYKLDDGPESLTGHYIFDLDDQHLNSGDMAHGGLLMTLADTVLGMTVAQAVGHMCNTITINCDFLSGAQKGERIEISTQITRKTRTVVFVSGTLSVGDRPVMTAAGVWRIINRAAKT